MAVPTHFRNEVLRLLGYEPPGFGTVPPTGFSDSATRSHSPLCATSPVLEISPSDRIKIAYSDSTPKRLALLVALVPVEPIFQRIRYGCDLSNDVGGIKTPTPPHVKESKPLRTLQRLDQPSGRRCGEKRQRASSAPRTPAPSKSPTSPPSHCRPLPCPSRKTPRFHSTLAFPPCNSSDATARRRLRRSSAAILAQCGSADDLPLLQKQLADATPHTRPSLDFAIKSLSQTLLSK